MSDQTSRIQGRHHEGCEIQLVRMEAGTGTAGRDALRVVPSTDESLLQRCRLLMDVLAEAQDGMACALAGGDVVVVKAAARRLMSVGWLFKEAADKHSMGAL